MMVLMLWRSSILTRFVALAFGLFETIQTTVFFGAVNECTTGDFGPARSCGAHVDAGRRPAPGVGAGVARGARVVHGPGRRARPARRGGFGRQQLGDAPGRVAENRHRREPSRLGAERRMARRLPRDDGGARSAADARGDAAAGDAEAGRLGRRGRRAVRAEPARLGGGRGQPEDRKRPRADGSARDEARRCARRERRGSTGC